MLPSLFSDDFLLASPTAQRLYHEIAVKLPIIDYHCHLAPALLANNHRFRSLTELWLAGDHYKWRAMRANGIAEQFITGDSTDDEAFAAWARTVPMTLRNPLYHWTHLELKKPFGICELLSPKTANAIYERCNELLTRPEFSTQGLLAQFNVQVVCTTDDPTDRLEYHGAYARSRKPGQAQMLPTFRPDQALFVSNPDAYRTWLTKLEAAESSNIRSFDDLLSLLDARHQFFHEQGCRLSDHGLETLVVETYTLADVRADFLRVLDGETLPTDAVKRIQSALLYELALMDDRRGWVAQYHLGALRDNNTRLKHLVGADVGCDSIGDFEMGRPLAAFLDRLDQTNQLAKTILYNLNPRDNELFATMCGNYQDGSVPGKLQWGAAWWFLDQLDGMTRQIEALSQLGLLSRFVGMLTDSRCFVSYSRHEYFRRCLCNLLGDDVERGLIPDDSEGLSELLANVCYYNAKNYFRFDACRAGET
jgi:glucuronate isomerase